MKSDVNLDQTQFMAQSPLLEEVEVEAVPQTTLSATISKQKRIKKIIIIAPLVLLIVLVFGVIARSHSAKKDQQIATTTDPELTEIVAGPFNQRLLELEHALEIADPNQEELPFPPIDVEISLEE